MTENRIVLPGPKQRTVVTSDGQLLKVPDSWELLPPGDGPLTKLTKSKGAWWLVQVKKGRRNISKGIWTEAASIVEAKKEITHKRSLPSYADKREKELARREKKQQQYECEFEGQVIEYLHFHPRYQPQAELLAKLITLHATPVGSGTVARTKRLPLSKRAENAVIAWLRHQATAYDSMKIPRIKGKRREVRRELARQTIQMLEPYRRGDELPVDCAISRALQRAPSKDAVNS